MPRITIIGAGAGLGLEIARAFGRRGFDVALVARTQSKLDSPLLGVPIPRPARMFGTRAGWRRRDVGVMSGSTPMWRAI